ncbi:MAG: alpha/beta hydrolase [candidate division NC10 bacterium]|nr:alpha/beta hydrolase [candidate division NC10 bacterium]
MEWVWPLLKILASIALLAFLIALGLSFLLVWTNTHPPRYPLRVTPANYGLSFQEVSFHTQDGIPLRGWYLPCRGAGRAEEKGPAVILCHGLGASKSDFVELAAYLCRKGFHVLLFDFRAHGDSGGKRCSLGYLEKMDLLAALRLLQGKGEVDPHGIGVYGFSLGGAVAIMAAAESSEFKAVVADTAFSSMEEEAAHALTQIYHLPRYPFLRLGKLAYRVLFGFGLEAISPMSAIGKLSGRPLLLIAGVGDETIPDAHAGYLYEAAGQPKELWLIQGAIHGGTLAAAGPEYERRVERFFSGALRRADRRSPRPPESAFPKPGPNGGRGKGSTRSP